MPFQPGNQEAKKRKASPKEFQNALRIAVNEAHEQGGGKKLRALADKLVAEALSGNVTALKEVADRLDGKPAQQLNHANETGDGPAEFVYKTVYEQRPDG
jgi:hypothetical protein